LSGEPLRALARVGRRSVSAREAARAFLRELLVELKHATGHRVRDLVVTAPVSAFEAYRAEVQGLLKDLGVRRVRFVDEPVAAALGYGLNLAQERDVLVGDIGGGTMHVGLVRVSAPGARRGALGGEARVLAKRGRLMGGNAVDGWVLTDLCRQMEYDLPDGDDEPMRLWRRLMLAEACRVKEQVFFRESETFLLTPPGLAAREGSHPPGSTFVTLTRARLGEVLTENGFYRGLTTALDEVFEQAALKPDDV